MAATKKDGTTRPVCLHLGRVLRREAEDGRCVPCLGYWVWACDKHGECTPKRRRDGVAGCCADCPDYDADA